MAELSRCLSDLGGIRSVLADAPLTLADMVDGSCVYATGHAASGPSDGAGRRVACGDVCAGGRAMATPNGGFLRPPSA
jgi:hypothetical protein